MIGWQDVSEKRRQPTSTVACSIRSFAPERLTEAIMSAKIVKPEGQTPDEFELQVAQELANLQQSAAEIKNDLKDLYITAAKQVDVASGRKAIVIFVPFRLHASFKKIQARLVRELEKKFSGRHVVIIAQRTILGKGYSRSNKTSGPRPRSRTLMAVQEAILDVRTRLFC